MGFLNSVKSRFKSHDEQEEEEFERAFREGRFPDDEGFEPLSSTGHFVATDVQAQEPSLPDPDEGLERMGMGTGAPGAAPTASSVVASFGTSDWSPRQGATGRTQPSQGQAAHAAPRQGQGGWDAPADEDPFAAPSMPHMAVVPPANGAMRPRQAAPAGVAGAQGGQRQMGRAPQQGGAVAPGQVGARMAPDTSYATMRPLSEEEGVTVLEREEGARSHAPARPQNPSFADRLHARVAAANVSGVIDDGLGRSPIAVNGPSDTANGKVVRPSGPARPRRATDVRGDELEAELAARRRGRQEIGRASCRERVSSPV